MTTSGWERQIIDGVAVLHWRKADEIYPDYPEPEEIVDLPDDPEERRRYTQRRKEGVYRETPDSVKERRAYSCAKAGFPWHIEVPDVLSCMWQEDDMGLGVFAYIKEMPLLSYARDIDPEAMSPLEATDGEDVIYRGRPLLGDMSHITPGDRVAVATLWTRTHWYEFYQPNVSGQISSGAAWTPAIKREHNW